MFTVIDLDDFTRTVDWQLYDAFVGFRNRSDIGSSSTTEFHRR